MSLPVQPVEPVTAEFIPFPKMARLNREVVLTEKIDGTNGSILITRDFPMGTPFNLDPKGTEDDGWVIQAGSRTRWLTVFEDNYSFAKWVLGNRRELLKLGPGRHFGEFWGAGIQRRYGLTEKRFSLFNVARWLPIEMGNMTLPGVFGLTTDANGGTTTEDGPACCHVVPTIWRGNFDSFDCRSAVEMLRAHGSFAAPGWPTPEGIVIFHEAAKKCFKVTLEGDEKPKSLA